MRRRETLHPLLAPEALALVAARFRALGGPTRLRLLNLLLLEERSVQELVEATGFTQTAVSRQLGVLRAERIVERRAQGKQALYRVVDTTIAELCRIVCGGLERRLTHDLRAMSRPVLRPPGRGGGAAERKGS